MENYNPQKIESKWQKIWQKKKTFQVDLKKRSASRRKPYYNLMMFPYPSGEGLHVGNVYAFTGSDIHGRFQKMKGFDVFEPMGFDAFGIHSENFAIKKGVHPKILIQKNINNFRRQLKSLGCLFDWRYQVDTTKPNYYKWTQWLFLQLFKAGLAYRKKAPVDWCPSCKTVLADEQVIQGKCERCQSEVLQKDVEQWFFRITNFAEKLLKNLDWIDWSDRTKLAQKNWIGRSEGALLKFPIPGSKFSIEAFTTRPDTLFGCTYLVLAPEHELVLKLKMQTANFDEVVKYIETSRKKTELERTELAKEKSGVELKGINAVNPVNNKKVPVFVADYVLASYGTGAIMAVPAHDQRDFDFAKKYDLPIKMVICPNYPKPVCPVLDKAYQGEGYLVGSGKFDGMYFEKAKWEITKFVNGQKSIKYHLRDWLISRQRYWGPPIPIIYCSKCGIAPVPEKDLPVLLPYVKNFRPKGAGVSPLAAAPSFVKTKCPKCGGAAKRETDVSDTFLDSAWYYFRYPSANLKDKAFDKQITRQWLPVNMYIGGHEHAVLHLMYSRFVTMALHNLGYIRFEEPFKKFRAHGLITKDGAKMSKSKGNIVNPDLYYKKFGADTLRMYLMFIGPFFEGGDWQDKGVIGISRFLNKIWNLQDKIDNRLKVKKSEIDVLSHKTIKKVTKDLENLRYNTAISALMILANRLASDKEQITKNNFETFLKMLAPFAPHITEELWNQIGNKGSVHNQKWPVFNSKLARDKEIILIVQVNGKVRDKVGAESGISENRAKELALSRENVKKWLSGKEVKKIIFVKDKLINIVV